MSLSARKLALMGILVALAIALNLVVLSVPNVEFLTFIVFSSGYLLGRIEGAAIGIISMSVFTTINPLGPSPPPIALAQIISATLIGLAGGLIYEFRPPASKPDSSRRTVVFIIVMGVSGLTVTVVYDLLTNLAYAFVMGRFWPVMVAGVPFSLVHIFSNVVIFVVLSPLLLKMVRFQYRKV